MDALTLGVAVGLWNAGIYLASEEGMLLERVDRWHKKYLPGWLYQVAMGCVTCMASLWGVFWSVVFGMNIVEILLIIPIAASVGTAVYLLTEKN